MTLCLKWEAIEIHAFAFLLVKKLATDCVFGFGLFYFSTFKSPLKTFWHANFMLACLPMSCTYGSVTSLLKFIYSEKATKFCEIFHLLLTTVHTVKSKWKILQNFVAFSDYMNFNGLKTFWSSICICSWVFKTKWNILIEMKIEMTLV